MFISTIFEIIMPRSAPPNLALKQYFTDASQVKLAMCCLLGDVNGLDVLEPSVGNGSLLSGLLGTAKRVDAIDVDARVLDAASSRSHASITETHCTDFVDIFASGLLGLSHPVARRQFDAVISNPPFGLYFEPSYRKHLKAAFPQLYVRESFGLFFAFSIDLLRLGGRYVFLLPDTFLTSRNHTALRKLICAKAPPDTIVRFPSRRFETVNFGYGSLCIIAGSRGRVGAETRTTWIEAFDDTASLLDVSANSTNYFSGSDLLEHLDAGWRFGMADDKSSLQGWRKLGELAECKTGIYTGDNGRFIGYDASKVNRRLNGHAINWSTDVSTHALSPSERAEGLGEPGRYVPLVRGGHRAFSDKTAWCIKWDSEALQFYRTDKRARLQNASFYFRSGLAVPMVTSKRLTASLLDGAVFDQGVVGVFPKNELDRDALLLFLNSSIATKLRNDIVNGSANNSANYLKRLPVPYFDNADRIRARQLISNAITANALPQSICDAFVDDVITKPDSPSNRSADFSDTNKIPA
jgi:adenine-specific DNA-methyltransferase